MKKSEYYKNVNTICLIAGILFLNMFSKYPMENSFDFIMGILSGLVGICLIWYSQEVKQ